MVVFYKKWKNDNKIKLTKYKMDINIRKKINHPHSPVQSKERSKNLLFDFDQYKDRVGSRSNVTEVTSGIMLE